MEHKFLEPEDLTRLADLESAIYEAGIDGGMLTSDAIEALTEEEKRLGVYTEDYDGPLPKWIISI